MELQPFGTDDFAENPEPRVPCVLILDVSSSMRGAPMDELNDGLRSYKDELTADSLAAKRVEVCVITFGSEVKTVCDFNTAQNFFPPTLEAEGLTYMGQAVREAMESVRQRKETYKANGISYYRPWLFLITDGAPNDQDWESAAAEAIEAQQAKSFLFFGVGVEGANMETLQKFCTGQPLKLKGLRFRDLFKWLSSSQQSVSRSTPGDEVSLENPVTPEGWATIEV